MIEPISYDTLTYDQLDAKRREIRNAIAMKGPSVQRMQQVQAIQERMQQIIADRGPRPNVAPSIITETD